MPSQPIIIENCCDPTPPPVPEVIDVLNCDLTTTAETFDSPLSRVVIVQDKPLVICATPQIDVEHRTICDLTTDTWHYITTVYIDGVVDSETSIDSNIPCSEPLPFPPDIEKLDRCDAVTGTIITDVYRYVTDSVTNLTTSTILSSIDTGIACNEQEIDKIVTNWLPICVDGVQWYVAESFLFNNIDQTETVVKIYKEGANGAIVTAAPAGTITNGSCPCVATPLGLLTTW